MSKVPFNGNAGVGTFPSLTLFPVPTSGDLKVFINPGDIVDVTTNTSGSNVTYYDQNEMLQTVVVSETPAAIAVQIGRVPLTIIQNSITTTHWYGISQIHNIKASGSGSSVSISPAENQNTQVKYATETPAAIMALIEAALPAAGGGGGGSFGSITATGATQGTAAAITTSVVRITGGAADTGVLLTSATGAEETFVHNATTTNKFVYPASAELIDPMLVNQGFAIGPNEAVLFKCTLAGHWVTEIQVSNTQSVAASGTVQGGGQIKEGVTNAIITGVAFGNTAATLPAALPGARINVQQLGGSTAGRLYPAGTDQINAGGAGVFLGMKADSTMELICNQAGLWVDAASSVKNLVVDAIQTRTSTGTVTIESSAGTDIARFSASVINFDKSLVLSYLEGTAIAGGNQYAALAATANLVNIIVSATLGDAVILSYLATTCTLVNNGVAPCYVYCDLGGSLNGVTNGYVIVAPGQTWYFDGMATAAPYAWTGSLLYSPAGSYVASAATAPAVIHPRSVVTTVAAPNDAVQLNNQCESVVIKNNGANALTVNPPGAETINGVSRFLCPIGSVVNINKTATTEWTATFSSPGRQSDVALPGGGQAFGTPVIGTAVNVATVATAGDSYTIQPFSPRDFQIWNRGANRLDLFPPASGTINGGAADAAFSIPAGVGFRLTSNDGSTWLVELLPGGAQVSTANVGSSQATGEPVVGSVECLVCANAGDAYSIQTWSPRFFYIRNSGANSLDLFPPVGGQINGGGANVALAVAAAAAYHVYSNDGVLWYAVV